MHFQVALRRIYALKNEIIFDLNNDFLPIRFHAISQYLN